MLQPDATASLPAAQPAKRVIGGGNRIRTIGPAPAKGSLGVANGDGGTKGGATYRFRSETAMLAWSSCPQPFPSREGPRVRIRLPPEQSHTNSIIATGRPGAQLQPRPRPTSTIRSNRE